MSMREKIALAMGRVVANTEVEPRGKWLEAADAVLDALMEPSERMINEGFSEALQCVTQTAYGAGITGDAAQAVWQAMIRAAKEGK